MMQCGSQRSEGSRVQPRRLVSEHGGRGGWVSWVIGDSSRGSPKFCRQRRPFGAAGSVTSEMMRLISATCFPLAQIAHGPIRLIYAPIASSVRIRRREHPHTYFGEAAYPRLGEQTLGI